MDLLISAFNTILYQPLLNGLVLLYQYLPGQDLGIAIIVLTVIIRVIFYPLMLQSIKSQKILTELQPKVQEIQRKYKNDKEKQVREIFKLYQEKKFNPFSGFLPLLIQLPILFALYKVFWKGLGAEGLSQVYHFVPHPGQIDPLFLGLINLTKPNFVLAIFTGICQFFQTKMVTPKIKKIKEKGGLSQFSEIFQKQMLYFFPIFTFFILLALPAAIALFWLTTTLFSIFQQYLVYKQKNEPKS